MRLIELMDHRVKHRQGPSPDQIEIEGVSLDSRKTGKGHLFAALPGNETDGRRFITDAVAAGARAVLAPEGTDWSLLPNDVTALESARPRGSFARAVAEFFGPQPSRIAAVTGTNGKTSVVHFLRQIWTHLGYPAASIGTLGLHAPGTARAGSLTTADTVTLHQDLAALKRDGVEHCALEASSHGLDQERLDGVIIHAAGFTNLGRDHLDYHHTQEAYFAAKARLFGEVLADGGSAVINADSAEAEALARLAQKRGIAVLSYGRTGTDLRLTEARPHAHGQELTILCRGTERRIDLPLIGEFQAHNALCAALLAACEPEIDLPSALEMLPKLHGVPGRLQPVGRSASGGAVYVDYAHTADALETVIGAIRPHCRGRLHVVFGCGGDRDQGKRPNMGRIAADLADVVIVTDDNPRGEDPMAIRREILAGMPSTDAVTEIGDRQDAIAAGIAALDRNDILLIAGKGHETGQIVGKQVLPFDDAAVARALLLERGAV